MSKALEPLGRFPRINFIIGNDYAGSMDGLGGKTDAEDTFTVELDVEVGHKDVATLRKLLKTDPVPLEAVLTLLEPYLKGPTRDAGRSRALVQAAFAVVQPSGGKASRKPNRQLERLGRWPRVNYIVMEDHRNRMSSSAGAGSVEYFLRLHLEIPLPVGIAAKLRPRLRDNREDRQEALEILNQVMDGSVGRRDPVGRRGRAIVRAAVKP